RRPAAGPPRSPPGAHPARPPPRVPGPAAPPPPPPAPPRPVDRGGLADLEALDAGPERLDPAGVLVAERERRAPRHDALGEVVHQVQLGVARPCPADPDEHLARPRVGLGHLGQLRLLLPSGEPQRAHRRPPRSGLVGDVPGTCNQTRRPRAPWNEPGRLVVGAGGPRDGQAPVSGSPETGSYTPP